MTREELGDLVDALMPGIERHIDSMFDGFRRRLDAIEKREPKDGKDGAPGRDGRDGKDGAGILSAFIDRGDNLILTLTDGSTREVGCIVGKDGTDGKDGAPGLDGKDGAPGRDGKDVDPETVAEAVRAEVKKQLPDAVAKIKTVKGDKGDPGPSGKDGTNGKDGAPGKAGANGKDGVGITSAVINRDGELALTLTDGSTRELGRVVGKDGLNGKDGADGRDGLGFEDLEEEIADDGRLIIRRYKRGSEVKEFRFRVPAVIDRGVYQDGREYDPGDAVTWAGALWICQAPTNTKPGPGDQWRLAVKRGRDGKEGPQGPKGDPGKDASK